MGDEKHKSIPSSLVIHIDELMSICGYGNSETPVNNHYGCNHRDNDEIELVRINKDGTEERFRKDLDHTILMISLRKKYGSYQSIKSALTTDEGKRYANEIKDKIIYDHDFVAQFGCKIQGKCFSFSCPLGINCSLEDLKDHDEDLYNDWKDEEYDPSEAGADLMLIEDEELIKKYLQID